ncbi:MAG: type II secretion system protein GspK [Deltaproteobacteria bacterium]|nr:type II secretion system protein GspK [Deltaproteobacteria bacterium]
MLIRNRATGRDETLQARPGTVRHRGIALLMALAVVMLLTMFISELFFSTGLELRAMSSFKEGSQSRGLSKAVFKALQIGLMLEESEFFSGYRDLQKFLMMGAVPLEEGLLLELDVVPLEDKFNLNEVQRLREGSDQDKIRQEIFFRIFENLEIPSESEDLPPEPIQAEVIYGLYSAIWDWVDSGDVEYIGVASVPGAEASSYFNTDPEVTVKNAPFDHLGELRLLRGVKDSRIPWDDLESRLAVLPKPAGSGTELFPERINVNVASNEEIAAFVENHRIETILESSALKEIQDNLSEYADKAQDVADELVAPEEEQVEGEETLPGIFETEVRETLTMSAVESKMKSLGLKEKYAKYLFITQGGYYRIRLVTEIGVVESSLEAVIKVDRDAKTGVGKSVDVLWVTLN